MLKRTHTCGQLRAEHIGQTVRLNGWVNTYRDQGKGLSFVDLRDRDGLTQVIFDQEEAPPDVVKEARTLRREDVVAIEGEVRKRVGDPNPKLSTGTVEVFAKKLEILNRTETPPILPDEYEAGKIAEEIRLEYRYIDLRRPQMQKTLRTRHEVARIARDYFHSNGFSRSRNAAAHQDYAGRRSRLHRAIAHLPGEVLRAAAKSRRSSSRF